MIFYICFFIAVFILDLIIGNYIEKKESDNKALIELSKSLLIFIAITFLAYLFIKSDFLYSVLQEKYDLEKANNVRSIFYLLYLIIFTVNIYSLFEVSVDSYVTYLVKNNSFKKYIVLITTFLMIVLSHILLFKDTANYKNILGNNNYLFFIIMFIITIIYPVLVGIKIYKYIKNNDLVLKKDNIKDEDEVVIARKVKNVEVKPKEKEVDNDYYEDEFLNDFDDDNF
jgi:membrane protein